MTFVGGLDLTKWFEENVTSTLMFSTATTSADPVHVLNGFLAQCLTGPRAPKIANELVAKRSGTWAVGSEKLKASVKRAAIPLQLPADAERLETVRNVLRELLATDGAVFPSQQSYQVAHPGFITNDPTGAGMGRLCASLLLEHADGQEDVLGLARRLCEPQPNPYWAVQSALLGEVDGESFSVAERSPVPWVSDSQTENLARDLGLLLKRAVRLGSVAADSLDALKVLANAAEFACILTYAQVPSLQFSGELTPMLASVSSDADTVRDASARGSVPVLHSVMDRWIASKLQVTVSDVLGPAVTDRKVVEDFLTSTIPYTRGAKEKRQERSRKLVAKTPDVLGRFVAEESRVGEDLSGPAALVLLDLLRATMAQSYSQWFEHNARRCGFLAPRAGTTVKRFCIEAPLVTTLVLAATEEDETHVSYDVWLDRLHRKFGILVGPGPQTRSMVPRATEADLEENREALAALLNRVGLARAYSDNTVEVLNPLRIWKTR
ncbi:hypothetical protein ACH427_22085 [Streptomyces sp. NPDC020379]|uniref:hypothetical protein n=1 Tax=Streptomyces sp. NPDC020379 TaxID=3365071 RepID=UPI0037BC224C